MRLSLIRAIPLLLAATLTVAGCAREISPNVVSGPSVGATVRTERGVIVSRRVVTVKESDTLEGNRMGLVLGGIAGGVAGNQVGGGFGRTVATGVGAATGAAAGALLEQGVKTQTALEYVVRNEIGQLYTVVQGIDPALSPGQRVYIQLPSRGRARIVPY